MVSRTLNKTQLTLSRYLISPFLFGLFATNVQQNGGKVSSQGLPGLKKREGERAQNM